MAGFARLLFCVTEDDDAAVRYVARLAAATSASLTLTDVIEDLPPAARRLLPQSWNLPAFVRAQKQARIEESAAIARRLGAHATALLLTGSPIKTLVREVVRGRHDLLAIGASSSGTVLSLAASATRLLRETPCPVLLVHASRRRRRPRILVAVDTDQWFGRDAGRLTAKLLRTAVWFAEKQEGELHVMHAWTPYGERMMLRAGLTDTEARQYVVGIHEDARQHLDHAIAPFRSQIARRGVHLVKGDARVVIADFAASHGFDLLVVGTVARSGVAGRLIGNTAEAMLNQLPCSTLVVKPDEWDARKRRLTSASKGRRGAATGSRANLEKRQ